MEIQWSMVNVTFDGVSRDSFMAKHRANHVSIAYAPDVKAAAEAPAVKSAMFHELGIKVHLCGPVNFD